MVPELRAQITADVEGLEELKALLRENEAITRDIWKNINKIDAALQGINLSFNQPPVGIDG